jgi:large subunit ribosomal protein L21
VTFDEVLLGSSDGEVVVGRPTVEGAAIRAEIVAHDRADKIVVFKFKRRKNYRRKIGHRQDYTEIRVQEIDLGGDRKVTLEPEAKPGKATAGKKKPARKSTKKTQAEASAVDGEEAEAAAADESRASGKRKAPQAKSKKKTAPKSKKSGSASGSKSSGKKKSE